MNHLITYRAVTLDDVLGLLSARTSSPSTMGAQLEALQFQAEERADRKHNGMHGQKARRAGTYPEEVSAKTPNRTVDVYQAQDNAENRMLREMSVIRCVDMLALIQNAYVLRGKQALSKLHKRVPARSIGELVVQCLRAYEENRGTTETRSGGSPDKALVAVYRWAQQRDPLEYPVPLHDEADLVQAFRFGKALKARGKAAELYADCLLVLESFVTWWNRQQIKPARVA